MNKKFAPAIATFLIGFGLLIYVAWAINGYVSYFSSPPSPPAQIKPLTVTEVSRHNEPVPMSPEAGYARSAFSLPQSAADIERYNAKLEKRGACKWVDKNGCCERAPGIRPKKNGRVETVYSAAATDPVEMYDDNWFDAPDIAGDGRESIVDSRIVPPIVWGRDFVGGGYLERIIYTDCPTCCDIEISISGGSVAVPESSSLGLLIVGGFGLLLARAVAKLFHGETFNVPEGLK